MAGKVTLHPDVKNTNGYAHLAEKFDGCEDELEAIVAVLCDVAVRASQPHVDDDFPRHEFVGSSEWKLAGRECKVCGERWPHPVHNVKEQG